MQKKWGVEVWRQLLVAGDSGIDLQDTRWKIMEQVSVLRDLLSSDAQFWTEQQNHCRSVFIFSQWCDWDLYFHSSMVQVSIFTAVLFRSLLSQRFCSVSYFHNGVVQVSIFTAVLFRSPFSRRCDLDLCFLSFGVHVSIFAAMLFKSLFSQRLLISSQFSQECCSGLYFQSIVVQVSIITAFLFSSLFS